MTLPFRVKKKKHPTVYYHFKMNQFTYKFQTECKWFWSDIKPSVSKHFQQLMESLIEHATSLSINPCLCSHLSCCHVHFPRFQGGSFLMHCPIKPPLHAETRGVSPCTVYINRNTKPSNLGWQATPLLFSLPLLPFSKLTNWPKTSLSTIIAFLWWRKV